MNFVRNIPKSIKKLHPNVYPVSGEGSWLYCNTGEKYLDLTSGIGALSTGHSHPKVIEEVKIQLEKYVHAPQQLFNNHNSLDNLTGKFLKIMPNKNLNSVFYLNSGSEAVDNAIKIARAHTKRQNIITIGRGFHGRTYGALSVTSSNLTCKKNINPLLSGVFYAEPNDIESFKKIIRYNTSTDEISCVIYEPVQGEGGVFSLEQEYLLEIEEICKKFGILTIADEVQCGFGRTGTFWNVEQKNLNPDILTFGKGVGSGFPIAGLVSTQNIMDNVGFNFLGGTYGGNAVCCAAASATIDIMFNEKVLDNVIKMGKYLKEKLETIEAVGGIRQYGLMIAFEIDESSKIVERLNKEKILILTCGDMGQFVRLLPPLNITKEECDLFLDKLVINSKLC